MKVTVLGAGDYFQEAVLQGGHRFKAVMLTLTYRGVDDWRPRHLPEMLQHIRKWLAYRGHKCVYVWVAELQQRGAVHYHVVLWLPKGLTLPKPDKQGWWPHGFTKIEWARKPVGYLAKYASKGDGAQNFPRGLRLFGHASLSHAVRCVLRWWKLPRYAREAVQKLSGDPLAVRWADLVRARGGGFVERLTGLVVPPVEPVWRDGVCVGWTPKTWHPFYHKE